MKRKPLEIKKRILQILKEHKRMSVKKLERKVNTNYQTIINNCEELEYFGFVKVEKTMDKTKNGREYWVVSLLNT